MSWNESGGLAFPGDSENGMTMLDWFAGQAMAAILANNTVMAAIFQTTKDATVGGQERLLAADCYRWATAMVAEKRRLEAK